MLAGVQQADKVKGLILFGLFSFIACNVAYDHFGGWGQLWYIGQAFAFVCYSVALWMLLKTWITELLIVATSGQLADELIGDPTQPDPIEYWFFACYLVYVLIVAFMKWRKDESGTDQDK